MFKATVTIRLRPSILDPQGKAVHHALQNLGYQAVTQVRIGKVVDLWIEADSAEAAEQVAQEAAEKLLANPVMEDFDITVTPLKIPASAG
ncbi:phosphoribosylformylglycinamidine synthase subunit PurS [Rhodothermus profundi]|uniref:Phosphoribosylformylglycinamidine synthase subunit PurS n=1 Tax=Rhodothermus profundi TaxID=633813 RepID=A0A1M6PPD2_9BACT|nr:phosphoribosylformylglycinamidine synthase subunit PurS [Rhodothermus profundi]SHK09767.1 phosphoribosylformylglycinamidine synthase [Rhodothermus profundi]